MSVENLINRIEMGNIPTSHDGGRFICFSYAILSISIKSN